MTRLYAIGAVLLILAGSAAYLRYDAIQDERREAALKEAIKYQRDRSKIDEAISDSRSSGCDWRCRLHEATGN